MLLERLRRTLVNVGAPAAVAVVLALTLVACGDSDDKSGSNGSAASDTTSSGTDPVQVALKYTGGKAGKADPSLKPIKIGWVNVESGSLNLIENTYVARASVSFINDELGGIDGHPVQLVECPLGQSEEQGQACAQKLVNDPDVKLIHTGTFSTGNTSFRSTTEGSKTPVVSIAPQSVQDAQLKNTFFFSGGSLVTGVHVTYLRDYVKAKSIAQVWPDIPAYTSIRNLYTQQLKAAGLKVTTGLIPPSASDALAPLVAAKVQSADAIQILPFATSTCTAFGKALKQLKQEDKPTIAFSLCFAPAVKEALGDWPKWSFYQEYPSIHLPDPSGEVDTFLSVLKKYRPDDYESVASFEYSPAIFGNMMLIAKWANEIGGDNVTQAAFMEKARAFTGPVFLGHPTGKFGAKPYPAVFDLSARFFSYDGDGKWKDATNGEWVGLPEEQLPGT